VLAALGVAVASFVFAIVATVLAPEAGDVESYLADPFSHSAIGHRAFVELVQDLGRPVVVSRHDSGRRAGQGAILGLLEPRLEAAGRAAHLREMLGQAQAKLLVLPKWTGEASDSEPGFLGRAGLVSADAVAQVLAVAGVEATLQRGQTATGCDPLQPSLSDAQLLSAGSPGLRPLIGCKEGILVGEVVAAGSHLVVVSDPDVLANHGLHRGDNAAIALAALEAAAPGRPLLVDVTLHGLGRAPSAYRDLFRYPLLLALVHAAVAAIVLVASGLPRFGRPLPGDPGLAPGKAVLIRNTAHLLAGSGHTAWLLERYLDGCLRDAVRALRGPAQASTAELVEFLRRAAPGSGVELLPGQVQRAGEQVGGVLAVAARIHRFREEILDGPRRDP
jgi:hypothetical protein